MWGTTWQRPWESSCLYHHHPICHFSCAESRKTRGYRVMGVLSSYCSKILELNSASSPSPYFHGILPNGSLFSRHSCPHTDFLYHLLSWPPWCPRVYQAVWLQVAVTLIGTQFWVLINFGHSQITFHLIHWKRVYVFTNLVNSFISASSLGTALSLTLYSVFPIFIPVSLLLHPNDPLTDLCFSRLCALW